MVVMESLAIRPATGQCSRTIGCNVGSHVSPHVGTVQPGRPMAWPIVTKWVWPAKRMSMP
jgi:hypothetical protein